MKSLILILLALSFTSHQTMANTCKNSYVDISKDLATKAKMKELINSKVGLTRALVEFLGIDPSNIRDWTFLYANGTDYKGANRNLELALPNLEIVNMDEKALEQEIDKYLSDQKKGSNSNAIEFGRTALAIVGTNYHHSFILGNRNTKYRNFYLHFSPRTKITTYKVLGDQFTARIETHYISESGKESKIIQTLEIDKSKKPVRVTLSEKKIEGLLTSDLWPRTTTIYINELNWSHEPKVGSQSWGL